MIATCDELIEVDLGDIGDRLSCYRILTAESVERLRVSLVRYGQIAPLVCYREGARLELIDGFKRLRAAREIVPPPRLLVRLIAADSCTAKAALLCLNRVSGRPLELEEARVVQALVREDGLSQTEVAELLGRHKSWVSRRLALLERLCPQAQEVLAVGLISPTAARELQRLPRGNQEQLLEVVRREDLTSSELRDLVDLLLGCVSEEQRDFVLAKPREALGQDSPALPSHDPRLSVAGNRLARRLALLAEVSSQVEGGLRLGAGTKLTPRDVLVLEEAVQRVGISCRAVAEAAEDFVARRDSR